MQFRQLVSLGFLVGGLTTLWPAGSARTLEIPTPRHNAYDAVALGMDPATAHARPATLQERAFSSPIWYTP